MSHYSKWIAATAFVLVSMTCSRGAAQDRPATDVYPRACAACHGPDGRGMPRTTVGFATPLPDFSDCSFASREPDADWFAIVHDGGRVRSFDRRMPAFGEALTPAEIQGAIDHIRSFCRERKWPRGELNLPRALVTEKAYPEDEAVFTFATSTGGEKTVGGEALYERRLGALTQFELAVPVQATQGPDAWTRGLGDMKVAIKRVLAHSQPRGAILSAATEVLFPTGKESDGLGAGTVIFEPFLAYGQMVGGSGFLQAQAGVELPTDTTKAGREGFWRLAVGRTFEQGRFGRAWSPMLEVLGAREFDGDEPTQWDAVPQLQVTLSKRQHVIVSGGVRLPLSDREDRHAQVLAYLLWDWYDGGLLEGWR